MRVVSATILRRVAEVSRGPVPLAERLRLAGLADDPPPQWLPASRYYALLERCGADDPELPLRYGAAVQPQDFGAFGLALKTARNVREGLERLVRFILVVSDTLAYALVPEEDGARLVLRGRPAGEERAVQLANECALAAIVSLLRQVAAEPVVPVRVAFRHAESSAPHERFYGAPVHFDAAEDSLSFAASTLRVRNRLADEALSAYLLQQLGTLHAQRAAGAVVQQVREVVSASLCSGAPSRDAVARRLGMSGRTLHRRLAEQDTSFQAVLQDLRRELSQSLLVQPAHSLAEVAYLTGFADQSAFQRAFKSWTGQTPLRFRQQAMPG